MTLTQQAQNFIKKHLKTGEIAVDATTGNGHDTLFLAQVVGKSGQIFGFDIQLKAIENTRYRLQSKNLSNHVKLFHSSHVDMEQCIPIQHHKKIKAIMFNLGYLPGSDKTIITEVESTLFAINKAINLLSATGVISIAAYPGHLGGEIETEKIIAWSDQLNENKYSVVKIDSSDKANAPKLLIIKKYNQDIF